MRSPVTIEKISEEIDAMLFGTIVHGCPESTWIMIDVCIAMNDGLVNVRDQNIVMGYGLCVYDWYLQRYHKALVHKPLTTDQ